MGLEYVDIFYHHRPDPETPLEETMNALASIVHSGKALYAGISQYQPEETRKAAAILKQLGVPCLIHQPVYNMFNRWVEDGLLDTLDEEGIGCIAFSPLAQGLLTNRYLDGIPEGSRATKVLSYLTPERIKPELIAKVRTLNEIAQARGQTMAEMALTWVLRRKTVTSALIGASSPQQLEDNVAALNHLDFSDGELQEIEKILKG
jgi:L-glyceraldehyde 3-phosphate reductase